MSELLELIQLAGVAYIAWRVKGQPTPQLAAPPAVTDVARAIVRSQIGPNTPGRERLRARLAAIQHKRGSKT